MVIIISIILGVITFIASYNIFNRRFNFKKYEMLVLSLSLGLFMRQTLLFIPSIINGEYELLIMLISFAISVPTMTIIWYKRGKKILDGYAIGIIIYFPIVILMYLVYSIVFG